MNDETNNFDKTAEQFAAFQKIWTDTFTRMMQAGFTVSPDSAPPEFLRQIRSGIFEALSRSWDEFLRSPQFLESMKQWLDGALAYRKMSTDLLTKAHHEAESPAREDIDSILLGVRQMEERLLDRMDEIEARLKEMKAGTTARPPAKKQGAKGNRPSRKTIRKL